MNLLKGIKSKLELSGIITDKEDSYLDNYFEFFNKLKDERIKFLEIGIFKGASLILWSEFFENGEIHGVDINKGIPYESMEYIKDNNLEKKIFTHFGFDTPKHTMPIIKRRNLYFNLLGNSKFDIILDDGAHTYTHSKGSFDVLFNEFLNPGGIYILEDWGTTYFPRWIDGSKKGEKGMAKMIKEFYDEVAFIDRLKGKGVKDLSSFKSSITSITIRFGQIWIFKSKE